MLKKNGLESDSRKKREQSENAEQDFLNLSNTGDAKGSRYRIDYLLRGYECERAITGCFLVSFPEKTTLWIGNVGNQPALVGTLGKSQVDKRIPPLSSITWPMAPEFRGRLRIAYEDSG